MFFIHLNFWRTINNVDKKRILENKQNQQWVEIELQLRSTKYSSTLMQTKFDQTITS